MEKPGKDRDLYTLIAGLILIGPVALSFDRKVAFHQYWPGVAAAIVLVGGLYVAWDYFMTRRRHWSFNPRYTGRVRILHLPPGELLFFIAVPYACLFVYEVIIAYLGDRIWLTWPGSISVITVAIALIAAWGNRKRTYSMLVLLSIALFFSLQAWLYPALPGTLGFGLFMGFNCLAFLAINGLYTALPTIWYQDRAIWGLKLGTIPVEDFLYNFSLLGLCLLIHLLLRGEPPWL